MKCTIHVSSEREKKKLLAESKLLYENTDIETSFLTELWKHPGLIVHDDKVDIVFDINWTSPNHLGNIKYINKTKERILRKSIIDINTGCRNWQGALDPSGYATFHVRMCPGEPRKSKQVHRISYMLFVGPVPEGLIVRHYVCDNPRCVEPTHLKLGTLIRNNKDRDEKGRTYKAYGNENKNAKLTEDQVKHIKMIVRTDKTMKTRKFLAEMYDITPQNIYNIMKGITWSHVTIETPDNEKWVMQI